MTAEPAPTAARIGEALRALEQRVDWLGWDQLPSLHTLFADPYGRVRTLLFPLPPEALRHPQPYLGMVTLAESMRCRGHAVAGPPPPGWLGWAFVYEAWELNSAGGEVTKEEALAVAGHRLIRDHPLKVEVRYVSARDAQGRDYAVRRQRGKLPDGDMLVDPEGAVVRCLTLLVEATLGLAAGAP